MDHLLITQMHVSFQWLETHTHYLMHTSFFACAQGLICGLELHFLLVKVIIVIL